MQHGSLTHNYLNNFAAKLFYYVKETRVFLQIKKIIEFTLLGEKITLNY